MCRQKRRAAVPLALLLTRAVQCARVLPQDETLREMLKRAPDPETPCIEEAHQMYFHILLNNAVLPATVEGKLAYQSVSPEEEALVSAAADMGWRWVLGRVLPLFFNLKMSMQKPWSAFGVQIFQISALMHFKFRV